MKDAVSKLHNFYVANNMGEMNQVVGEVLDEIARLRAEVEAAKGMTVHILADNERLCELVKDLQPRVCGIDQSPCPYAPCDNCVPNLTAQLEREEDQVDRLNGLLIEQYNTCQCKGLAARLELANEELAEIKEARGY